MRTILAIIFTMFTTSVIANPINIKCSPTTEGIEFEYTFQIDLMNNSIFIEDTDFPRLPISVSDDYISWETPKSWINLANYYVLERSSLKLIYSFVTSFAFTPSLPDSAEELFGPAVIMYQCVRGI